MQAKYTVLLKTLIDNADAKAKIDAALSKYPLYEKKSKEEFIPSYIPTREELNNKILNAYKYREIAFETVGRFVDELEISMSEIMPYYNQLFFSADQDYNILFNVDYQRTTTTNRTGTASSETEGSTTATANATSTDTSEGSTTGNNDNKVVNSKTPQNDLSITAANIENVSYADEVSWNKSNNMDTTNTTGTTSSESSSTNTETSSGTTTNAEDEEILETTKGNFGVMATQDLITKYRDLIVNIEQQIINDERISELFLRVY